MLLDTSVHLAFFFGNKPLFNDLMQYLLFESSNWKIVMCETLRHEVERNLKKSHVALNLYYHLVYNQFLRNNKLYTGKEMNNIPKNCQVSDNDDVHLVKCALGSNSNLLITTDTRLHISQECGVKKMYVEEFMEQKHNL